MVAQSSRALKLNGLITMPSGVCKVLIMPSAPVKLRTVIRQTRIDDCLAPAGACEPLTNALKTVSLSLVSRADGRSFWN